MKFKEVIGQKEIKTKLIQSVRDDRISHAQLFLGSQGSGNFPMAFAYARYILCRNRQADDSCDDCPSCNKSKKLIHPDLHFVFPVATTKSITKNPVSDDFISEWRSFVLQEPYVSPDEWYSCIGVENKQGIINKNESIEILRKLNLKTYEADYKIVILWLPEKMNLTAANKLLKMLEEPPEGTIFLLVSENTDGMLPTVLSRTQMVRFPPLADRDLLEAILTRDEYPEEQINDAVKLAGGNYSRAVDFLNAGDEPDYNHNMFIRLMRLVYAVKLKELLEWVEDMASSGREKQKKFLQFALRMIRENYLMNMGETGLVRLTADEQAFSSKFSVFINSNNAEGLAKELNLAHNHIEANAYARIVFLDLSLKLAGLIKQGQA